MRRQQRWLGLAVVLVLAACDPEPAPEGTGQGVVEEVELPAVASQPAESVEPTELTGAGEEEAEVPFGRLSLSGWSDGGCAASRL